VFRQWFEPDISRIQVRSVTAKDKLSFLILVCEAIGTAATPGLLCQPRVIVKMIVEKQMKCKLAGETQVLGENLPQRHFCPSQNPTWSDPGLNPGRRGGKPATNRLSYGAAKDKLACYISTSSSNSISSNYATGCMLNLVWRYYEISMFWLYQYFINLKIRDDKNWGIFKFIWK
jgi:hypothetical protein